VITVVLALGWAVLLAAPLVERARRAGTRARAGDLSPGGRHDPERHASRGAPWERLLASLPGALGRVAGVVLARRQAHRLDAVVARELPVTVDLLAVAVGAGCTPFLAVDVASRWAPPTTAELLAGVRRACTFGRGFDAALDDLATAAPLLRPLADALLASDRYGAPVGDALARLSGEQRTALRRRAEAHARTVPVRLLFPLVFLVLPAFGLLTVVPSVLGGLGGT
jgi:Flp pilus assembly protein TadB